MWESKAPGGRENMGITVGRGELGTPCDCADLSGPCYRDQESCLQLRLRFLISNSLSDCRCLNSKALLKPFEFSQRTSLA